MLPRSLANSGRDARDDAARSGGVVADPQTTDFHVGGTRAAVGGVEGPRFHHERGPTSRLVREEVLERT